MVKKAFNTITILSTAILYCFVVILFNVHSIGSFSKFTGNNTSPQYATTSLSFHFHSATEGGNLTGNFYDQNNLTGKEKSNSFSLWIRFLSQLYVHEFLHYIGTTKNIFVNTLLPLIIYPFHYFW